MWNASTKAPTAQTVDVSVALAATETADFETVKTEVEQTLAGFFSGRLLGEAVLLAELGNRIYGLEGVKNYRFTAPAQDIVVDETTLPVLGSLSVTEMEA